MQFDDLIKPHIELLQLIQRLFKRDHVSHIHPRRERSVGVRHREQCHTAAAFFGIAFTHKIDHDRAQNFADVGEKLQPCLSLQTFALGHAHEAFVHQRRGVEPGDAAGLCKLPARKALDVGIEAGEERAHRVGVTRSGALHENGGWSGLHDIEPLCL